MKKLTHIICGQEVTEKPFISRGFDENYEIGVPRLTQEIARDAITATKNRLKKVPSLKIRKRAIESLMDYEPSEDVLEGLCRMSGHPVTLVKRLLNHSKQMLNKFLNHNSYDSNRTCYIGIPPNDPRESFFFIGQSLLAGSPVIIKPSAREPILTTELVKYLHLDALKDHPGMLNLIHADTTNNLEGKLLEELMRRVDVPIVMGSTFVCPQQISFNADHSRALVLDADKAIPHLENSILFPHSCLAEHNYIVVGKENFEKLAESVIEIYNKLKSGDLMDPETNMSLVNQEVLEDISASIRVGEMYGNVNALYPNNNNIMNASKISHGVVVEHFSEDKKIGVNPLMTTSLPLYITCLRFVEHINEALLDLNAARNEINIKYGVEKSMALGLYGEINSEIYEFGRKIAFDVHINESPYNVGLRHQNIDLNKRLTKR